jgi:hypothetical protein
MKLNSNGIFLCNIKKYEGIDNGIKRSCEFYYNITKNPKYKLYKEEETHKKIGKYSFVDDEKNVDILSGESTFTSWTKMKLFFRYWIPKKNMMVKKLVKQYIRLVV